LTKTALPSSPVSRLQVVLASRKGGRYFGGRPAAFPGGSALPFEFPGDSSTGAGSTTTGAGVGAGTGAGAGAGVGFGFELELGGGVWVCCVGWTPVLPEDWVGLGVGALGVPLSLVVNAGAVSSVAVSAVGSFSPALLLR